MKLEQSFEVAAPLERVWEALIDVERVAPCLPGASVIGRNEDGSYNGEFKVKIGPTSAAYSGKLNMENVDAEGHTATMQASGTDKRGQGGAKATIVSTVTPAGGSTKVDVSTDYHITGRLARFGRGGMIEEISARLLGEFSANLQAMLAGDGGAPEPDGPAEPSAPAEPPAAAEPSAPAEPPAPAAEPAPPADPDDAIEGATPVTPAAEPVSAPPNGSVPPPPPPRPTTPAPEPEPLSAFSLVGSVAAKRVKENPAPFAALVLGFLFALRILRRRD